MYMHLPFQPVIILNSARAALDLMEKRSNIYSDKMFTTLDEMYVPRSLPYHRLKQTQDRLGLELFDTPLRREMA